MAVKRYRVPSRGERGAIRTVTLDGRKWSCSCLGWRYSKPRQDCRHIKYVKKNKLGMRVSNAGMDMSWRKRRHGLFVSQSNKARTAKITKSTTERHGRVKGKTRARRKGLSSTKHRKPRVETLPKAQILLSRPVSHLTARMAWHDNKWNGTICKLPEQNEFLQ